MKHTFGGQGRTESFFWECWRNKFATCRSGPFPISFNDWRFRMNLLHPQFQFFVCIYRKPKYFIQGYMLITQPISICWLRKWDTGWRVQPSEQNPLPTAASELCQMELSSSNTGQAIVNQQIENMSTTVIEGSRKMVQGGANTLPSCKMELKHTYFIVEQRLCLYIFQGRINPVFNK